MVDFQLQTIGNNYYDGSAAGGKACADAIAALKWRDPHIPADLIGKAIHICCAYLASENPQYLREFGAAHYASLSMPPGRDIQLFPDGSTDFTLAKAIAGYLADGMDKSEVREMTLGFPDASLLGREYKACQGLRQEELDRRFQNMIERAHGVPEKYGTLFFIFLYLWSYGIESYTVECLFASFVENTIETQYRLVGNIFHFTSGFPESAYIKKSISRLREKLAAFLGGTDKDHFIEKHICQCLSPEYRFGYIPDGQETPGMRHIGKVLLKYGLILCGEPGKDRLSIVQEAVNSVFSMYIVSCYEDIYIRSEERDPYDLPIPAICIDGGDPQLSEGDVARYIRQADIGMLYQSCLWASVLAILEGGIKEQTGEYALYTCERINLDASRLIQENREKEKEIKCLEETVRDMAGQLSALEGNKRLLEENQKLSREANRLKKAMEQSARIQAEELGKSGREVRSLKKKVEALSGQVSSLEAEKEALLEEIRDLRTAANNGSRILPEVDVNRRYLFIIDNERMKPKLMAWFPNSVLADNFSITPLNCSSIYMAVFITKSICHASYKRIKQECVIRHVPMAYCNDSNFLHVCDAIATCIRENNLEP